MDTARVAVVTGASSGIGREIATRLLELGYRVYDLSRRGGGAGIHIPTDISNEADVASAFCKIEEAEGGIDLLINNAGFGISGAIEFSDCADVRRIFEVNLFGAFLCAKSALPLLRKRYGRIVNVSSAAAVFSIPFQGFYSATKAAINSLTLALRSEVEGFGVSVCAVMPGDVQTGFTSARKKSELGEDVYGNTIASSVGVMEKDERSGMTSRYVAEKICKIATKKSVAPLYTIGFKYKVFALLAKLLPTRLVNAIVRMLYIKK